MKTFTIILFFMLAHSMAWAQINPDSLHLYNAQADSIWNSQQGVKCPFCVLLGLKSTVRGGTVSGTLMYSAPYWDENGNYHYDDPNIYTSAFECSNWHYWEEKKCRGRGHITYQGSRKSTNIIYGGIDWRTDTLHVGSVREIFADSIAVNK